MASFTCECGTCKPSGPMNPNVCDFCHILAYWYLKLKPIKIQKISLGDQGFPLSCVIDEPNSRCSGFFSTETSVNLICQKHHGIQLPASQYTVASCPIQINHSFSKVSASMPILNNILSSYTSQVRNNWPRRLCVRHTRWRSECVAGHCFCHCSVFLLSFFFSVFCFWPTSGNLPCAK